MQDPYDAPDPRELLARFRASYRDYVALRRSTAGLPDVLVVQTLAEHPLEESNLPDGLRRELESLREDEPASRIELVKHLRICDGVPELVVDDESELPADDELVVLSETTTLNTLDRVHVVTEIYVARRT